MPRTAESRERKRTQNEESELPAFQEKKLKTSEEYPASGLKSSLHGTTYQLKLLMLFLKRGLDKGYSFNLATEVDAAEKFDDVVFQYTEDGEEVYRFLQAKHKQDDNKKITVHDLLTEQDGEFSLQKYFISYRKITQNPQFKGYKLKDFVICTNIDLEERLRSSFEPVKDEDSILRFRKGCEKSERLKLNVDKFSHKTDLFSKLKNTSERYMLAKRLAKCVLENKPLDLKDYLFRSYHGVLGEKVIDLKNVKQRKEKDKVKEVTKSYAKFHSNFLDGSSQELENFRSDFFKAYDEMSIEKINANEFWQKMRARELQISQNFGKGVRSEMSVAEQAKGIIKGNMNKSAGLPDNDIDDKEIESFFEKLVFAVKQPNEIELGDIIKTEMGEDKYINLIDCELIASKFQEYMLNWMKEKKGRIITHENGKAFFKEANKQISKLALIGPTLEYHAQIEDFGIAFSEEPFELSNFLDFKSKRQLFNLINSHRTILSSIKVHQTLKRIPKYQKDDSHIFVSLSSLLRMKDRVIKAFETSNNLLVIECKENAQENVGELCHELAKVIRSSDNKKIILITRENDPLVGKFKNIFSEDYRYEEKKDEKNKLIDLKVESQEKLLNTGKVVFQGEEVSLVTLLDESSKRLIDGEILSKLINNEKIEIGKALTDSKYNDVKDYYIDRTFNRPVKIEKSIKEKMSGFFIIYNGQVTESNIQQNDDIVMISDTEEGFADLRNKHKERNIHWLKIDGEEFLWQQSYGDLSKLRKFVDTNEQSIQEYKPKKITDIKDRVVIIAAEPGMGKSTVLTHLGVKTKESNPSLWIVRINLLNYSAELKALKISINKAEAMKFIYRTIDFQIFQKKEGKQRAQMIENFLSSITVKDNKISLKGFREKIQSLNSLEIELFNYFYNQGSIALLFDGYDEIIPDYKEKVNELLQVLKTTKVKNIWVTTRPYGIINQLENKLNTFSYTLKPLSPQDQRSSLEKFWKENLKLSELDDRSSIFTDNLIKKVSQSIDDKKRVFFTIPLHIWMIARIYQDAFKEWHGCGDRELSDGKFSEEIDLIALYERFIYIKFHEILFGEKNPDVKTAKPLMKRIVEAGYKQFIADHGKLAVYTMFKEDEVRKLLLEKEIREVRKLMKDIEQGKESTGIIDKVVDNKPRFIHRTFAEYFIVKLISDRLKSKYVKRIWDCFINIIINEDYHNIRKFFESKLASDHELANLSSKKIHKKRILKILLEEEDNPLCAAAEEGLVKTVDFLLKSAEGDLDTLIAIINTTGKYDTPLCVAIENGHRNIVEVLIKYINDVNHNRLVEIINYECSTLPLNVAVEKKNKEILNILLDVKDKDQLVDILIAPEDDGERSALYWAVMNDMEDILCPYLNELSSAQFTTVLLHTRALDAAIQRINFDFFHWVHASLSSSDFKYIMETVDLQDMPIDDTRDDSVEVMELIRVELLLNDHEEEEDDEERWKMMIMDDDDDG